jgi:hypothetical protein
MTKQTQVFRNVCTFIKDKTLKYHIYIGIQTLYSVLVEAPLAVIKALSRESSWV